MRGNPECDDCHNDRTNVLYRFKDKKVCWDCARIRIARGEKIGG